MISQTTLSFCIAIQRQIRRKLRTSGICKPTMSLGDLRVNYSKKGLDETSLPACPYLLFSTWISEARETKQQEPNAMCLSTSAADGRPSARMVLLKAFDNRGFVWYTNYESRKANQLAECPYAALTFWWPGLERSIRIEGIVAQVEPAESDEYFASRPPASRLGAWASDQSRSVSGRDVLEKRWKELQKTHLTEEGRVAMHIPRPQHWGGYRLVPDKVEFWKGREFRLHDRILYERELPPRDNISEASVEGIWTRRRLQP